MAKKKDASTGSADASSLRRSSRETSSSKKQITPIPVNSKKPTRNENHTPPNPSPVIEKPEKIEKQMGLITTTPLRRYDRGKKLVETSDLPNTKSTEEKDVSNSKKCLEDVDEDEENEKQDSDVVVRKRKRFSFTALRYKALFQPQKIRIDESDDERNPKAEDKLPQAITNGKEDVDKELKSQNGIRVQEAPEKGYEPVLEGRVINLDQIEHGDCPQTKSLDGKSIESGDLDKQIGGNERDLEENQQQLDNNEAPSNSKFVEFWVPVQMSNVQLEQYTSTLLSNAMALRSSSKSDPLGAVKDVFLTNRKCCNHPYIADLKLQESLIKGKDQSMILDIGIKASGKFNFLDHILPEIQNQKSKVLILFQRTGGTLSGSLSLGDILVDYIHKKFGQDSYEQLEGAGAVSSKKQAALNTFNTNPTKFIFLLESRACHQTIKLSADVIIIFDSDLNPSNDLKSLQKMSIESHSEQIMLFRLYCSSTLEEMILKLAENNMAVETRLHNLRNNYDTLLTWGVSDLFEKLTKFHSQSSLNISSEESLLKDVVEEFLYIVSHKGKRKDTSKGVIVQLQNSVTYEVKTNIPNGDQPCVFWRKLLEGRFPMWKFVSESTPRQRKRPSYFLDNSHVDTGARSRRKTVNVSSIEPAQLKTVAEGEVGGVNEGVTAENFESRSSSGDQFWSTAVDNETSLFDFLKPTVSELCSFLKFSEDVKMIVEKFLEFVLENYQVGKEHKGVLEAFMISLCWIGSSLGNNEIDRCVSFALVKNHFNFCCMEEEANSVYNKLEPVKEPFLQSPQGLCLKHSVPELEVNTSQHIPSVGNHESCEKDGVPATEEAEVEVNKSQHIPNVERDWEKERAGLEHEYKLEKIVICQIYGSIPSLRSEKLKLWEREFANKLDKLEEERRLAAEGQVAADRDFSLHSGNPEVGPTLPETQSHDEAVCEGANDIESTGSHTSERDVVDATASSEQVGPVPAQQVDEDVEVDVVELEDNDETGVNDMAPRVDCGDVEVPDGDCNEGNDGNCTVGVDDVAPRGDCGDVEMPDGGCNKENDENDDMETIDDVAGEVEDGEICPDKPDAVEMEMPAGTCDDENAEDGEICPDKADVGDGTHSETISNDVAETGTPAGTCDKENTEYGETNHDKPDDCDDHDKSDDVLPRVESAADMETPAGTKENAEDGEIILDTPDNGHDETSVNDVLVRIESAAEMETPAGTCDKENAEDGEIMPDTGDDHEDGEIIPDASGAGDEHNEHVEMEILVDNEENVEDSIIWSNTLQANEDRIDMCGSGSSNPACAAIPHDTTPSVEPVSSPASDHLEPIIPEIQNELLQLQQLRDNGVQDDEINIGNLQPSGASQVGQVNVEQMVAENPSDPLPTSGRLLEPMCEEPTHTVPQSGENLEVNLASAAETPQLATSVAPTPTPAPAPVVNGLNQFDNLTYQVNPLLAMPRDPLQVEAERLCAVKDNVAKYHLETKQKLKSERDKEIEEVVAQIRHKYEAKQLELDIAYNSKKLELETNYNRVIMNRILADAFRSKCRDLNPSGHPEMHQAPSAELMQHLHRLGSPSMRRFHGNPPSSRNHQPQLRPQLPLQIVHQPGALFSTTPSRPPPVVNQITSSSTPPTITRLPPTRLPPIVNQTNPSTTPTTTRPPSPIINQITPSTTPTTTRLPPVINQITPSTTPSTSRQPPVNVINPSGLPNRSPPSITQINMSAANLRINTETRRQTQTPHVRPVSEPRAPAPHLRPLVRNEPVTLAPRLRPLASTRAPAPHLRPFRSTSSGMPSQHVTSGPSQAPVTVPSQPPPSEPCTAPPLTPLVQSSDNLNGVRDNAPRWVDIPIPQHGVRSQFDRLDITDLTREGTGTAQSSSARDLVCLSDDD